jgi:hypothetical protein
MGTMPARLLRDRALLRGLKERTMPLWNRYLGNPRSKEANRASDNHDVCDVFGGVSD